MVGELIVNRYVAESITTDAGRFDPVGLCQLHTNCTDIDNVAMSLYNIIVV